MTSMSGASRSPGVSLELLLRRLGWTLLALLSSGMLSAQRLPSTCQLLWCLLIPQ